MNSSRSSVKPPNPITNIVFPSTVARPLTDSRTSICPSNARHASYHSSYFCSQQKSQTNDTRTRRFQPVTRKSTDRILYSTNTSRRLHSARKFPRGTLHSPNKTSRNVSCTRILEKRVFRNQRFRTQDRFNKLHIPENLRRNMHYCGKVENVAKTCPGIGYKNNLIHRNSNYFGNAKMYRLGQAKTKFTTSSERCTSHASSKSYGAKDEHGYVHHQVDDERSERMKSFEKSTSFEPLNNNIKSSSKYDNEVMLVQRKKKQMRLFESLYERISKKERRTQSLRIDLRVWKVMKNFGMPLQTSKTIGPVPGVEVGDRFEFRIQLMIMGIHSRIIRGIDYKQMAYGQVLATSIVATQGYYDNMVDHDELVYTGEGGTFEANGKDAKDQELKRGNLALKNSMDAGNYVRVVRGIRTKGKKTTTFVYDGLYKVVDCYMKMGPFGKLHLKFKLLKYPGQKCSEWKKYYM